LIEDGLERVASRIEGIGMGAPGEFLGFEGSAAADGFDCVP